MLIGKSILLIFVKLLYQSNVVGLHLERHDDGNAQTVDEANDPP
jgi:hypothetical protein